jgi:capsular exopolysaccharide synthesis family protein
MIPPAEFPNPAGPADADPGYSELEENDFRRNAWLMVLERKWYALTVFLVSVLGVAVFTFLSTPIYEAAVTVQVLKHSAQVLRVADVVENSITSDSDFNTQIKVLESVAILQSVANRLTPEELKQLTDPYKSRSGDAPNATGILYENRRIRPQRFTLITTVGFSHPNPKIAARMANLIAAEYIAYNSRLRIEESMKAVDDLKDRADQQRKRVDEVANSLQAFRQRGNLISLVQSKDIVTEKLKALNLMATETNAKFKEAQIRWNMVEEWTKAGRDLTELPFIASQTKVNQLLLQVTSQKLTLAQLRERYKAKHPKLIETTNSLAQAELELRGALATAASSIRAEYEDARANDTEAHKALAEQEAKSLELDKSAVEYDNLDRDFRINNQLLEAMIGRIRETSVSSSIETDSARIIDRAFEPAVPVSPRIMFNLTLALVGGIVLGLGTAYLVALIDDRVKTIFDVERLVGMRLLGLIPKVEQMDQPDKAQIVANGADRVIVESFLSLYSTLRIDYASRNAKRILVTSTLPGEGKSFVATNLALTYALQGQRTVIVDCDLRKPNIARSFRLRPGKGWVDHCTRGVPLDEVIARNVQSNLDVVPVGDRAKNPIQLLNGGEFESMLTELGKRYDRVILDTPPLGAVSDVLNILPLVDGAIYVIQFNRVKRAAARRCARRLRSTNVTIFGVVLNDMSAGMAGAYYGEQDTKMLKGYYESKGGDQPAPTTKLERVNGPSAARGGRGESPLAQRR